MAYEGVPEVTFGLATPPSTFIPILTQHKVVNCQLWTLLKPLAYDVAGKTTLLRHLLQNSELKIGCVVNDVSGINIDAKLIRNDRNKDRNSATNTTSDLADTVELSNGCACKPPYHINLESELATLNRLVSRDYEVCALSSCTCVASATCSLQAARDDCTALCRLQHSGRVVCEL